MLAYLAVGQQPLVEGSYNHLLVEVLLYHAPESLFDK